MWPFSNKTKTSKPAVSVAQALELLAAIGIRRRPGVSDEDLLLSLGGTMDSPVDWVDLLCVLGGDVERGKFGRISDDIWHVDAECIVIGALDALRLEGKLSGNAVARAIAELGVDPDKVPAPSI